MGITQSVACPPYNSMFIKNILRLSYYNLAIKIQNESRVTMAKIKILITDLDNAAVTPHTTRPDLLADKFVTHAVNGKFKAYYVCTHRAFCTMLESYGAKQLNDYKTAQAGDPALSFTHIVIPSIKAATGLNCLAVSTPDDLGPGAPKQYVCGSGYDKFIAPTEKLMLAAMKGKAADFKAAAVVHADAKFQDGHQPVVNFNPNSKNEQLKQILADMAQQYPNDEIEVDFLEDVAAIRNSARNIPYTQLPRNVKQVNIFECDASKPNEPIRKAFEIREPTVLERIGAFFTPSPVISPAEKAKKEAMAELAKFAKEIDDRKAASSAAAAVVPASSSSAPNPAPAKKDVASPDDVKLTFTL